MKLQFLGDSRDAFKWDVLHHVVTSTRPAFKELAFVPMLTPDEPTSSHGSTPASRYPCRPPVLDFVRSLADEPRELERVDRIGSLPGEPSFGVHIHRPSQCLGFGWQRHLYWQPLVERPRAESLVFIDPDNGFETENTAGQQHLRFGEAGVLLTGLPETSAMVVFQYRPQGQSWDKVFSRIGESFPSGFQFAAVHDGQLAFIFIGCTVRLRAVVSAVETYTETRPKLKIYRGADV